MKGIRVKAGYRELSRNHVRLSNVTRNTISNKQVVEKAVLNAGCESSSKKHIMQKR